MSTWIVNIGGMEYPARDRDMIAEWFRAGRITADSTIFHPDYARWLTMREYAEAHAPEVIVSTTPSLDGYRILVYIAVEATGAATLPFKTFVNELDTLRNEVLQTLRTRAVLHGGNAVVGISFDYMWGADLVPIMTASGTVVLAAPSAPAPPPAP